MASSFSQPAWSLACCLPDIAPCSSSHGSGSEASSPSWCFFAQIQGKQFRVLGWAFLVVLAAVMFSANGRPYYVAPAYPMLFAAGAVAMEAWFSRRGLQRLKP